MNYSQTLKVLLVEDSRAEADLLRELLPSTGPVLFEFEAVSRLSEALEALKAKKLDVALLDLGLPDSQGLSTFTKLRQAAPDLAVVVLTGNSDQELAISALQEGAQDYLVKGHVDVNVLVRAMRYAVERKAAEVSLRASETRYRRLFETAKDGILILDFETGAIDDVNPFVLEMLGTSREALLGKKVWELGFFKDILASEAKFLELQRTDYIRFDNLPLETADGRKIDVEFVSNVYLVNRRKVIQCNIRDVTERRRAQEALRQSEEKFKAIANFTVDWESWFGPDGKYLWVNPAVEAVTGYTAQEALSMPDFISVLLPKEERPRCIARFAQAKSGADFEFQIIHKKGHRLWLSVSWQPIFGASGNALGTRVSGRDVTERRQMQAGVAQAAEEWQRTFDATNDAIWILDKNQRVLRSNKIAERFFHRPYQNMVGRPCWEIVHGTQQPTPRCPVTKMRRSLHRETEEMQIGPAWLRITVDPILDAAGEFAGAVHIVTDITEHRQLQASVAQSDRLASMGMLAAGVAHEINNPLSYVLYNLETLAEDVPTLGGVITRCLSALAEHLDEAAVAKVVAGAAELLQPGMLEDVARCAQEALGGARRIREISRGLGTFSRVESVEKSAVNLKHAIESAASMAQNEIKYRAQLVKSYAEVPSIWGSEGKLSQVFLNLLINAAHATEEGHVDGNQIGVRTWAEGHDVFAEVTDTGKGIPPENLKRIFEPFFTTKPAGVGSGLGLAICKSIVSEFGGDIQVESEVGKGTRFVIRLPAHLPRGTSAPVVSAKALPSTVRGRILVVDDEESIRKMLQRLLGREHEVLTAASGDEARGLFENDRAFDVVLCDLMMPKVSGMELHEWVIARDPALAARMVFMTGGGFTSKASDFLARITNVRIEKPVPLTELKRLVSELILAHSRVGDR
jgi:PAS domain S-box-containing protein